MDNAFIQSEANGAATEWTCGKALIQNGQPRVRGWRRQPYAILPACLALACLLCLGAGRSQSQEPEKAGAQADVSISSQPSGNPPDRMTESAWRKFDGEETLYFKNGDKLRGNLHSIQASESRVLWQRGDAESLFAFDMGAIARIRFPGTGEGSVASDGADCEVRLINGDHFLSELEGMASDSASQTLSVSADYAGALRIPLKSVAQIRPLLTGDLSVWDGFGGLEGWTLGEVEAAGIEGGYWEYHEGAIYATKAASIARDVRLPDVARIEMDLEWRSALNLALALYTDYWHPINLRNLHLEPDFGGFYSLSLNNIYSSLRSVKKTGMETFKLRGRPELTHTNAAHIEILADKPSSDIHLFVNGTLVSQWHDENGFAGAGTGVRFVHQGQGAIKIDNFKVSKWDGHLARETVNLEDLDQDAIKFIKGEELRGEIKAIQDRTVRFEADGSPQTFNLQSIRYLAFGRRERPPPETGAESRQTANFYHGGQLTFDLVSWTDERIVCRHGLLGELQLDPSVFETIEFE